MRLYDLVMAQVCLWLSDSQSLLKELLMISRGVQGGYLELFALDDDCGVPYL